MSEMWDADRALSELGLEQQIDPTMTIEVHAKQIYQQGAVMAAKAIVHLAKYSSSESTRLKAATIVTDRVLGRVQDANPEVVDPLTLFLQTVTKEGE